MGFFFFVVIAELRRGDESHRFIDRGYGQCLNDDVSHGFLRTIHLVSGSSFGPTKRGLWDEEEAGVGMGSM